MSLLINSKYLQLEETYHQLQDRLADPSLDQSSKDYQKLVREYKKFDPIYKKIQDLKKIVSELKDLESLQDDPEMKEMAFQELKNLRPQKKQLETDLDDFLVPKDPEDDRDVIIEIRAGTGGDEAAIFAGDLFRMYSLFASERGFQVEIYSSHPTGLGGFKEIIAGIKGQWAYRVFKHESGVHRVQRVPKTEAGGRVHTSTVTVAVMSEADEVEVDINPKDLRIDVYRASGAGGQHVNKTESAVRITHLPSNTVVTCQDERSQMKNKAKAMNMLRARLYQMQKEKSEKERRDFRRTQVGTGERNEKIRTYNYSQDRVTDHRINQSFHNLPGIIDGNMTDLVKALLDYEKDLKMSQKSKGDAL